jgi:CheY-like chemotaxis protein
MPDLDRTATPPPLTEKRQRTILLVDDEGNILSSLRRLLRPNGYRILSANGGAVGLALLAQNDVDVVLSDQRMPGMTGVEFLRQVKVNHPHTVRMVLSGYTELQSITDAINEGAVYKFLTKPWEDGLLKANIEEAFRYKELNDENRRLNLEVVNANKNLAQNNLNLLETLADKERSLELNGILLNIAQEVLHCIPYPVIGLDNENVVVFANEVANSILGMDGLLLGLLANEVLPEPLLGLVQGNHGDTIVWRTNAKTWRVQLRSLGLREGSRTGQLLMLFPSENER